MHYSPQRASGFKIDEEVAEGLGLLKEYKVWKDDWDYDAFCDAFEEKYGAKPSELKEFEYQRGGYIQGLEGFEYDADYVLWSEWGEDPPSELPNDLLLEEATWAELG